MLGLESLEQRVRVMKFREYGLVGKLAEVSNPL